MSMTDDTKEGRAGLTSLLMNIIRGGHNPWGSGPIAGGTTAGAGAFPATPAAPAGYPLTDMSVAGPWGGGQAPVPVPTPRPDPATTGAVAGAAVTPQNSDLWRLHPEIDPGAKDDTNMGLTIDRSGGVPVPTPRPDPTTLKPLKTATHIKPLKREKRKPA